MFEILKKNIGQILAGIGCRCRQSIAITVSRNNMLLWFGLEAVWTGNAYTERKGRVSWCAFRVARVFDGTVC